MGFDLTGSDSLRINECINLICQIRSNTTNSYATQQTLNADRFAMQHLLSDLCYKYMNEEERKQLEKSINHLRGEKSKKPNESTYLSSSSKFEREMFEFAYKKVREQNND